MKSKFIIAVISTVLMLIPGLSSAEMFSANYRIATTVMSGGGAASASHNYQMNSTVGQPSPLSDLADPPFSDSFDLYSGFWHTVVYDSDGDELAADFGALGLWDIDTAGTWRPISGGDCQSMAGWANGLAMDFDTSGLWNVDTAWNWTKIAGGDAEALTDVDLY